MNLSTSSDRFITGGRRIFNRISIRNYALGLSAVTFLSLWLILGSAYLPSRFDLNAGEVARDTIRAPRSITFENEAETERRRVQAAEEVPRVYSFDADVLPRVLKNINSFFDDVSRVVAEEKAAAQAAARPYDATAVARKIENLAGQPQVPENTASTLASLGDDRMAALRQALLGAEQGILEINVTENTIATDRDRLGSVLQTMGLSPGEQAAAAEVGGAFLEPNNVYSAEKTQQARERAASDIQPVLITVRSGETIASPGQVVTDENVAALKALGLTEQGRKYGAIMGLGLLSLVQVLFIGLYILRFEKKIRPSRSLQFVAASLLILFAGLDRISIVEPLSSLLVPMAALGMLGTFILGTRMAIILVIMSSANLAVVAGPDPQFVTVALLGGLSGALLVTNISQRRDLVRAGLISGAVVITVAVGTGQIGESSFTRIFSAAAWGAGNAVLAVLLTGGLLTFYELLFNLPTPLKLLELADPTRPLLKELMMRAPGTYNHSIIMGNIAETAAEAIGANPLLARVGAYYHDIGKLNRPDYFIENQFHVKNPHDRLTPGLSRLAITAHVKDGVQLAQDEGLPPEIIDIVKEHHGTTVLQYFYQKAKETDLKEKVNEETYRYAGHKPATREAAIVMLADSVEAAVRSLKDPSPKKIKTVIRDIFDQRLRDGQLSESSMTFGDLEKVRQVFERSLKGFGATRIAYPEVEVKKPQGPSSPAGAGRSTGAGR